jgi:type IV pilus assembly protein PilE
MKRGFSLIELLMALAIAGLLAALALPGYSHVLNRAHRLDARLALLRIQHLQESYFASHLVYASRFGAGDPPGLAVTPRSDHGHYLLELQTAPNGMSYTAVARADPAGRPAVDRPCAQLAIDQAGRRRAADAANLWRDDDPNRCWG